MAYAHQQYLEKRHSPRNLPGNRVISGAMAFEPSRKTIIHTSTAQLGGAEISLLNEVLAAGAQPRFIIPSDGPLSKELIRRGLAYQVLAWPAGLSRMTQKNWLALLLVIPNLFPYLLRLRRAARGADVLWSSGFKSQAACLLLAPFLGPVLLFDVRDFLRPKLVRHAIAWTRRFGCRVRTNSMAVAADFPGAEVVYPKVGLRRPASPIREGNGRKIVTHLAFFAPYKGQDLFLQCARALLDAGVNAEFWVVGDVIYPAAAYSRYREKVYALAAKLNLAAQVHFLGKVEGGGAIQALLERTDLLLHCTREPEPYGRAVMEALLCGCEAVCHGGSGVCETVQVTETLPEWMKPLRSVLGPDYVRVSLRSGS